LFVCLIQAGSKVRLPFEKAFVNKAHGALAEFAGKSFRT